MAVFEFGTFALDPSKRTLLRDGVLQTLTPKAFDLLVLLVEQRERVLSKEELLGKLWPNAFVEEANLSQQIFLLRRALDEDPNEPSSIATVPRRGYRFVTNVTERLDAEPETEPPATSISPVTPAPLLHSNTWAASHVPTNGFARSAMWKWLAAGLAVAAGLVLLAGAQAPKPGDTSAVVRFQLYPPEHLRVGDLRTYGPAVISPDGRRLVFVGIDAQGRSSLWMRALDQLTTTEIIGTDGAAYPFWSPDSEQLAYFADGKLKKTRAEGGMPTVLAEAPIGRGGTWSSTGMIVFVARPEGPLHSVAAAGRTPPLPWVSPETTTFTVHLHPSFLPDGHRFLFLEGYPTAASATIPFIGELGPGHSLRYAPIGETHSNLVYAPAANRSSSDHLLYVHSSTLMAQPVGRTLEPTGEAIVVATDVRSSLERWRGDFSTSFNGVLVYRSVKPDQRRLAWYDRQGNKLGDVPGAGSHRDVALSPDGTMLAVHRFETSPVWSDIWIQDLERGTETRFTLDGAPHHTPVWARDGSGLFFITRRPEWYAVDYVGVSERHRREVLRGSNDFMAVTDSSADDQHLLYQIRKTEGNFDLWLLELGEGLNATPFLATPFNEGGGQFSPDGRWIAYVSNESAIPDVYVASRDRPEAKVQVSANGGLQPRWRRDGRELLYVGTDGRLMSVAFEAGSPPRLGPPVPLFQTHIDARSSDALQHFDYDVSPDGQRIITLASPEAEVRTPWTVVINWPAALGSQR